MPELYQAISVPPPAKNRSDFPVWVDKMDGAAFRIIHGSSSVDGCLFRRYEPRLGEHSYVYNMGWIIPLTKPLTELEKHKERYPDTYQRLYNYFRGEDIDGFSIDKPRNASANH